MKKVLVIAYHYPPIGGGGVFRTLKFTKYLPQFGFKPYVLTVKNAMYPTKDPTLLEDIPPEVRIIRTFSLERKLFLLPFYALRTTPKWIFIPDINIGWLSFAVRRGEEIIKKENINVIYATAPIYTSLLIGCLLKRKTGKPLVIDFRDPWTQNVFAKYPTRLHKKIEEKMEKHVLMTADYIITATEPMRLKLIEKYPFIKGKCATITNGFDPEDFKGLTRSTNREKFTITFTGYLYGLRTAKYFLIALKELIKERKEMEDKIQVLFAGPMSKQTEHLVKDLSPPNVLKLVGYVSHQESLKLMLDSDLLLLIIAPEEPYTYTTKLFEYLGTKRPILALVPPQGVAADLIRSTKAGIIVPPKDTNSIKQAIFKLFQEWERGDLRTIQSDVSEYDRKVLTEKLSEVFRRVYSKHEF
jgi:glycosyltransferase involved in cell wall biosynthesis